MMAADMAAIHAIQCAAYPATHHESVEVLLSHWRAAPPFCYVAEGKDGLDAYLFSHPWAGSPPPLHEPLQPCAGADHLFIHDLAVHPDAARQGFAAALLRAQRRDGEAGGFGEVRLVAVGPAVAFWRRQGFRRARVQAGIDPRYGDAMLMEWSARTVG